MNPTNTQQNITQQLQSSGALEQLRNIANQRLGNTATAGVQRTSQAPLQTIPSADRFGKVTNPILPTPVNSQVAQDNLATNVGTFTESATSNQMAAQEAAVAPVSQKQTVLDKISSLLGVQATQGERTQDIFEEAGVAEKRALVTKLENEALTKDRAYQKQAEKIRQNAGGALDIGVQSQLGDLDRKRNSELADIAIQAKVAQGLYTDAVAIAEAKVKAEFEPLENQIKSLQNLYNLYQDDLTASEKLQAQAKIQEQQASLDFQRDKELLAIKNKYDIQSDARAVSSGLGGVSGDISPITQSIIDNPSLFDDLTATLKGKVIGQLQAAGMDTSNLGIKGLSDTAIKEVSQTQKALEDLDILKEKISANLQFVGPIKGLQKINPFSKSRQIQADVDRVRQTVGKALEGGVLRKEDEEKYKKILATLTDTPETAIYKIDALRSSLERDIANYKSLQQSAGRSLNVSGTLQKKGATNTPEDLRAKYKY